MLKFKTSCAVIADLSSNLLNKVGLSLFRYFEVSLRVCDIVVKKFTFAISSPDEFLFVFTVRCICNACVSRILQTTNRKLYIVCRIFNDSECVSRLSVANVLNAVKRLLLLLVGTTISHIIAGLSVIVIGLLGRKCKPAASRAAPW